MSTAAAATATTTTPAAAAGVRNDDDGTVDNDMCPICKSSRYLNPSMKFLVNPECYHKMCESCVDRIFSLGPATCPYAGCGKILRKNKFKQQLFEDLAVEREVDVRKRVAKTFNRRQDDFEMLEDYNNYLEEVEGIVFNLVMGVDAEATEAKLQAYEQANRTTILANSMRQKQDDEQQEMRARYEQEQRQQKQQLARILELEEQQIREDGHKELLRELATSKGDAETIKKKINNSILKRSSARRRELESEFAQSAAASSFAFMDSARRRRRDEESPAAMTPFTPFVGDRQTRLLFEQRDDYYDPTMDSIAGDMQYVGSGFKPDRAIKQSLLQAFFGLGCNIQKEKATAPTVSA
ncbi:hypothetical protein DV451_003063 [Geotrichum candidum]|uniref:RNA polymerase II transcription factor B subunit 3 n=1 Tax=Geotrichum candidum TaxID=1173061 RepID=A0A9P5KTK5_GEOCN|nr:hypothetical protein DV451_003063 [Geotrichum candidum]KAF5110831.1 hypothetical protein DV453_000532 [Geotrichum candidum]KAF5115449.1 hypothetical protein DV454_002283 [Geotrichum candidum]